MQHDTKTFTTRETAAQLSAQLSLFPDCALPGCSNVADQAGDACSSCVVLWGPYICRHGERPAWVPSGWVRRSGGGWGIPWGIAADPELARAKRLAAADRLAVDQDLPTRPDPHSRHRGARRRPGRRARARGPGTGSPPPGP